MSNNYHQFIGQGDSGGDDDVDDRSTQSSIGMATCDENFTANHRQFNDAIQGGGGGGGTDDDAGVDDDYRVEEAADEDDDDAATIEVINAVTRERTMTHEENTRKFQSILKNIKNSTKNILAEMNTYLQETAEIEKTYIRCRANTQKESGRMERVEPDVIAATQREYDVSPTPAFRYFNHRVSPPPLSWAQHPFSDSFVVQTKRLARSFVRFQSSAGFSAQGGAQLSGGAAGCVSFANMAALLGGGGRGDSTETSSVATARNAAGDAAIAYARTGTVTPRGNDVASRAGSMAGSSMAGSVS
jgi:hypothetical protein